MTYSGSPNSYFRHLPDLDYPSLANDRNSVYDYQIVRTINSKGETDLTMQRDTGSGWVPIERSQRKFIELLMPKELSDIFFFNGENLQKSFIETEDASKSMRDSVLTVTGIKSATHTIYYLEQYLG